MRHIKLVISYDGTDYVGWQVQPNGRSIQQCLESAWASVSGEQLRITASGRTDSGVHALGQVCSFATKSQLPTQQIVRAINAETPFDISVLTAVEAPDGFHAIRDAKQKTYRYHVQYGRIMDPLRLRTCWYVPGEIDLESMQKAAVLITGEHDFASFESAGAERSTTIRNVIDLQVTPESVHNFPGLEIAITANGFLYNMVRNIVGTLIRVGKNREEIEWVAWVRDQKNRRHAGQTAPAHGLFLDHVVY